MTQVITHRYRTRKFCCWVPVRAKCLSHAQRLECSVRFVQNYNFVFRAIVYPICLVYRLLSWLGRNLNNSLTHYKMGFLLKHLTQFARITVPAARTQIYSGKLWGKFRGQLEQITGWIWANYGVNLRVVHLNAKILRKNYFINLQVISDRGPS